MVGDPPIIKFTTRMRTTDKRRNCAGFTFDNLWQALYTIHTYHSRYMYEYYYLHGTGLLLSELVHNGLGSYLIGVS